MNKSFTKTLFVGLVSLFFACSEDAKNPVETSESTSSISESSSNENLSGIANSSANISSAVAEVEVKLNSLETLDSTLILPVGGSTPLNLLSAGLPIPPEMKFEIVVADPSILIVDRDNNLVAIKNGKTDVTIKVNGQEITFPVEILVSSEESPWLDSTRINLNKNGNIRDFLWNAEAQDLDPEATKLWKIEIADTNVINIASDGNISKLSIGSTTIKATLRNDSTQNYTITVEVYEAPALLKVSRNTANSLANMLAIDSSIYLSILEQDCLKCEVTWSLSDSSAASLSSNLQLLAKNTGSVDVILQYKEHPETGDTLRLNLLKNNKDQIGLQDDHSFHHWYFSNNLGFWATYTDKNESGTSTVTTMAPDGQSYELDKALSAADCPLGEFEGQSYCYWGWNIRDAFTADDLFKVELNVNDWIPKTKDTFPRSEVGMYAYFNVDYTKDVPELDDKAIPISLGPDNTISIELNYPSGEVLTIELYEALSDEVTNDPLFMRPRMTITGVGSLKTYNISMRDFYLPDWASNARTLPEVLSNLHAIGIKRIETGEAGSTFTGTSKQVLEIGKFSLGLD